MPSMWSQQPIRRKVVSPLRSLAISIRAGRTFSTVPGAAARPGCCAGSTSDILGLLRHLGAQILRQNDVPVYAPRTH